MGNHGDFMVIALLTKGNQKISWGIPWKTMGHPSNAMDVIWGFIGKHHGKHSWRFMGAEFLPQTPWDRNTMGKTPWENSMLFMVAEFVPQTPWGFSWVFSWEIFTREASIL
jgi:hypothetical protein